MRSIDCGCGDRKKDIASQILSIMPCPGDFRHSARRKKQPYIDHDACLGIIVMNFLKYRKFSIKGATPY